MLQHWRTAGLALAITAVSIGTVAARGGKPSFHPATAAAFHPIRHAVASQRPSGHGSAHAFHRFHKFHRFAFRHSNDQFGLPLIPYGDLGFYGGGYYDPGDDAAVYPPYPAVYGPDPAPSDRVGGACRSEEVTVPGSSGPVRVTVTRC